MSEDNSLSEPSSSGDETPENLFEGEGRSVVLEDDYEQFDAENFEDNEVSNNDQVIAKNSKYLKILQALIKPKFEDVTPMVNSAIPFLIDGDALMLSAVQQENYSLNSGGQFLQIIYFCERILDIFTQKGGHFIIVFFDVWKAVWDDNWCLQTCRLCLYNHFKHNTDFSVYKFSTFYDQELCRLIEIVKPRCIFFHLGMHLEAPKLNIRLTLEGQSLVNETKAARLLCGQILCFFEYHLSCVDIDEILPSVSLISSFHLEDPSKPKSLKCIKQEIKKDYSCLLEEKPMQITVNHNYKNDDIRRSIVTIAASEYLKAKKHAGTLKLILLCYAAQEVLKLENRGCSILQPAVKCASEFRKIILDWHRGLYYVLSSIQNISFKWDNIVDLWQGTLFNYICSMVAKKITDGKELGLFQEAYENLVNQIWREAYLKIPAYPIEPLHKIKWSKPPKPQNKSSEQVLMHPVDNTLINRFCGSIFEDMRWTDPKKIFAIQEFNELRHWHNRKPLTDECDHIHDDLGGKPTNKQELVRYQRQIGKQARFMSVYGRNLENTIIEPETIICTEEKPTGAQKKTKEKNESKKAREIKNKNLLEKGKKQQDAETKMLNDFESSLNKNDNPDKQCKKLNEINLLLAKVSSENMLLKANVIKLQILAYICKKYEVDQCLANMKEIFLTIRKILRMRKIFELTEKQEKLVASLLYKFGFDEIAQRNNLPFVECEKILELNWIRYQLEHIAADLEKEESGDFDPDVGYAPDPWQKEFIEAIRKNESALVVAPTSSGKTFASYYCMKRVLQQSSTGIVVYVSPTKALVNQVAATVYHRFSKVNVGDGVSVVGVFTRDYKFNALNARILVTVPQCLDLLLLSPRRYSWVKRIKYVIFDEVHRLSGSEEGLVWERCLLMIRCPFLALSATVSEPERFYKWLQNIENFKKGQDTINNTLRDKGKYQVKLVVYSKRHSDLIKYTYGKDGLVHLHPFSTLDKYALDLHEGIPSTISLSPYETLQLYDAICSCTDLAQELHLDVYFKKHSPPGFIKRETVREYERQLGKVFYHIYDNNIEIYKSVLQKLDEGNSGEKCADVEGLLNTMHEKNMLPALIFSYNRNLVEILHEVTIENLSTILSKYETPVEKLSKAEEREKKKQLQNENEVKMRKGQPARTRSERPSLNILQDTGSKFKGIGTVDKDDIELIESRLLRKGLKEKDLFIRGFQLGIAYHHAGLNNIRRSSVEMLFRLGVVRVVFATGTLALGIHMPCKSVVVFGDSPFLNSLEYHQMSGRAGRRGFDIEGNVIFIDLENKRRDRLMTDKLPAMIGNYPISVTLVLRLLLLVNTVTDKNRKSEEATNAAVSSVLTLLENSLIFQSKRELIDQIKHFVGFSTQLLILQDIIDNNGTPLQLTGLITHLHYHEPANLALAYIFRTGALRKLLSAGSDIKLLRAGNDVDILWSLMVVLSHLFARIKLHQTQLDRKFKNSVVILEPLPDVIKESLKNYNEEVKFIFNEYIRSIALRYMRLYGADDTLPLSKLKIQPMYKYESVDEITGSLSSQIVELCPPKVACSAFVTLSGHKDENLFGQSVINNIRHQICPDINAIPLLPLDIQLNAYALDFYRHGIGMAIIQDNGIRGGQHFTLLKDFMLMLKTVTLSFEELEPVDAADMLKTDALSVEELEPEDADNIILKHFRGVRDKFEAFFRKQFK